MRTLLLPLLALLAASCGGKDEPDEAAGDPSPAELAARLDAVSQLPNEDEREARPRLTPIDDGEVPDEYRAGPACRLSGGAGLLLVAAQPGAVAKIDGRAIRLVTAGPVGPSGGFWKAPGVTISVGARPGTNADGTASPAGVTVGGADDKPIQKWEANWVCA